MEGKVAAIILMNNEKKFLLYLRDNKPEIPYIVKSHNAPNISDIHNKHNISNIQIYQISLN